MLSKFFIKTHTCHGKFQGLYRTMSFKCSLMHKLYYGTVHTCIYCCTHVPLNDARQSLKCPTLYKYFLRYSQYGVNKMEYICQDELPRCLPLQLSSIFLISFAFIHDLYTHIQHSHLPEAARKVLSLDNQEDESIQKRHLVTSVHSCRN